MRSMTGYGAASHQAGGRSLTVEIRAVNQRFLEVKFALPREFLPWEGELRSAVQGQVARGKVDVAITRGGSSDTEITMELNRPLAKAYASALRELQEIFGSHTEPDLTALLGRGELLRPVERRSDASSEIGLVRETLERALAVFNRDREREGRALGKDMVSRAKRLQQLRKQIASRAARLTTDYADRLRQRVQELLEGRPLDEERLLQEVTLIAERSDVTEELVRLASHLEALVALPKSEEPIGKRLDFLLQEIHREFNTIASKSADLEVTNATIEARGEIEKLKEQTQNIE